MTIGERIKQLREEHDMTQTELADAVGTAKQNIYKYENGIVTNIPSEKVELIAKQFGVSPAYIMGWTDELTAGSTGDQSEGLTQPEIVPVRRSAKKSGADYKTAECKLLDCFKALNETGRQKALDYLIDLSEQEKYTRQDK